MSESPSFHPLQTRKPSAPLHEAEQAAPTSQVSTDKQHATSFMVLEQEDAPQFLVKRCASNIKDTTALPMSEFLRAQM